MKSWWFISLLACRLMIDVEASIYDDDYDSYTGSYDYKNSESRTCTSSEFRCKTGRCIPMSWRCDNEKDCSDGSDEEPGTCMSQRSSCPEHKFVCTSGHCIPAAWHCDDAADCPDGSDEHQCGKGMIRGETQPRHDSNQSIGMFKIIGENHYMLRIAAC
ncbi:unnamed protein product [Parnassius apollo]|uniref:(apollo) hypothetical protein n=1 Tax=Parnassius apollo TaxID=110799 RepID=A0A8S3WW82_PARAO|nr:unnamed protein product [Parnassius apollo]